jgi:hypothetical protein
MEWRVLDSSAPGQDSGKHDEQHEGYIKCKEFLG